MAVIVSDGCVAGQQTRPGLGELIGFRGGWYRCLTRRPDTLFEMGDALLCAPGRVASLPYLSLEPVCRRGWGSVYAALADGGVDVQAARELLAGYLPRWWWPVFAVDVTAYARLEARCSPRRGMVRVPDPGGDRRGRSVPGWAYQWVVQVSDACDSWVVPADVQRVDPDENANEVACGQMRGLAGRLARLWPGVVAVFCLDGGYCPITATIAVVEDADHPARVVVRIRRDRVFYFDPDPAPGRGGRRRVHGDRFDCADQATWPCPHEQIDTVDERYGPVRVQAWHQLHPRPRQYNRRRWGHQDTATPRPGVGAPIVRGSVIRISLTRPGPGQPRSLWLWSAGPDRADLQLIWRAYLRRFGIEHAHRFIKQHLAWDTPTVRSPEQADRWSWVIAAAYTQLHLAKPLVADLRLPWEKRLSTTTLTPARVRRGFRHLTTHLPPTTKAPKPTRAGPGRRPGQPNKQPTTRHKVIIKNRQRRHKR